MTEDFSDFTESAYRRVLAAVRDGYRFERFGTRSSEPHVLWRHDVDVSVHRALRLATIEAEARVSAAYCFWLHSPFYSLSERPVLDRARATMAAGPHQLGLHFESGFYGMGLDRGEIEQRIVDEARILSELLEGPVELISFHNPGFPNDDLALVTGDEIAGLVNAYGPTMRDSYGYVSDSNGYWRHRRLLDVIEERRYERLHVLTHPEWWQAEPMPPRARIARSVEGRAAATLRDYDDLLARAGRENLR